MLTRIAPPLEAKPLRPFVLPPIMKFRVGAVRSPPLRADFLAKEAEARDHDEGGG